MSLPIYITSTQDVGAANGGDVKKVILTPAAAVATLVLRERGSGGTIIASFQAAASGASADIDLCDPDGGMVYSGQLHATLGGAGAAATIGL